MSQDNPQHDPRLDAGRAALIAQLDPQYVLDALSL
jgi:hypothetical protein